MLTTPLPCYQADVLLIGLREIYGEQCVEFPRKDMLYGDMPCYYGRGFTLWSRPIQDVPRGSSAFEDVDLVIYASHRQTMPVDWRVLVRNKTTAPRVIYIDGNDDSSVDPHVRPIFKRELFEARDAVFPINFGISEHLIRPLDIENKSQLHQTHVQDTEFTSDTNYKFTAEKDYFDDLARSFFGITMQKAGWDCMRHYEIMAAGTLVMFKHLDRKPPLCAPRCPDLISYTNRDDFMEKTGRLMTNGKPNAEYLRVLEAQRTWLLANGTCSAIARYMIRQTEEFFKEKAVGKMPVVRFRALRLVGIKLFVLKETLILYGLSFVKLNPFVDWLYSNALTKIPGMRFFIFNIVLTLLSANSKGEKPKS